MKIAIHKREGSYSDNWIEYCVNNKIPFKVVNSYDTNIIEDIKDCDIFLWHWPLWHSRDILFSRQLLFCLEAKGIKTFPNLKTCMLYDDKVGQKYLFELLDIPHPTSYNFYYKEEALKWVKHAEFPKIFKLRGGAGSTNVKLVKNRRKAIKLVKKAFCRGFSASDRKAIFLDRFWQLRRDRKLKSVYRIFTGLYRFFVPNEHDRVRAREKSYVFFQDFINNLDSDIRVIVIGERAFAIKRKTRINDFRASGSGLIIHDPKEINIEFIKLAFDLNLKLNMQSVAFDFVKDNDRISLLEISYCFILKGYKDCPGYWDKDLVWHEGKFDPSHFMIEDTIKA